MVKLQGQAYIEGCPGKEFEAWASTRDEYQDFFDTRTSVNLTVPKGLSPGVHQFVIELYAQNTPKGVEGLRFADPDKAIWRKRFPLVCGDVETKIEPKFASFYAWNTNIAFSHLEDQLKTMPKDVVFEVSIPGTGYVQHFEEKYNSNYTHLQLQLPEGESSGQQVLAIKALRDACVIGQWYFPVESQDVYGNGRPAWNLALPTKEFAERLVKYRSDK
jgi:hypothetical protein